MPLGTVLAHERREGIVSTRLATARDNRKAVTALLNQHQRYCVMFPIRRVRRVPHRTRARRLYTYSSAVCDMEVRLGRGPFTTQGPSIGEKRSRNPYGIPEEQADWLFNSEGTDSYRVEARLLIFRRALRDP